MYETIVTRNKFNYEIHISPYLVATKTVVLIARGRIALKDATNPLLQLPPAAESIKKTCSVPGSKLIIAIIRVCV